MMLCPSLMKIEEHAEKLNLIPQTLHFWFEILPSRYPDWWSQKAFWIIYVLNNFIHILLLFLRGTFCIWVL